MTDAVKSDDDGDWVTPIMDGVPAAIATADGALSTFSPDFAGIMVGADYAPGIGGVLVVGVLQRDQSFVCGATTAKHWRIFQARLNEAIERLERGEFDKAPASS